MACTRETDGNTNRNVFTTDNKCIWLDRLDTMQSNWSHSLQTDTLHSYISNSIHRLHAQIVTFAFWPRCLPLFLPLSLWFLPAPYTPHPSSFCISCMHLTHSRPFHSFLRSSPFHFISIFPFNSLTSSSAFSQFVRPFSTSLLLSYSLNSLSFQSDIFWWFQFECNTYPFVSLYDFDFTLN